MHGHYCVIELKYTVMPHSNKFKCVEMLLNVKTKEGKNVVLAQMAKL